MKIAIIGAGPSGLVASIFASRNNAEVHIFDKNSDVGKKLLLTGNGKCNYWNLDQNIKYYHSYNNELLPMIINEENLNKVKTFLENIGIIPLVKNNYCYPYSGKSSSMKSALKKWAEDKKVYFRLNENVTIVKYQNDKFYINGEEFNKLIIATGAKSYPKTGSDGFGYEVAKKFGHTINVVNPSLMQVITNIGCEKEWTGIRSNVNVSLYENGHFKKVEKGEIQFTDYGLSGICIFNLSRDIRIGLNENFLEEIHLNLVPWYTSNNFINYLDNRSKILKNRNITELCDGFLDYKLLLVILKVTGISKNKSWNELNNQEQQLLAKALTDFNIKVVDTKGFENAQTCSGGIPLSDINLQTMESKIQKGLYFCGEIIDVDGDCGGYNLTFAFISGMLAGMGVHYD